MSYDYDRRGRQIAIAQSGGGTLQRIYNDAGLLVEERFSAGPLNGLAVTNGYDALLRRTNLVLLNAQGAVLASTAYRYDATGRLQTVSEGPHSASYQYLENSPLVAQITFATDGQTVMTTSKEYDALNRLTAIASHPGGTPSPASVSFAYSYNAANQRIRRAESDSSYWSYQYDALGQVISGKKYWADGTPVAGQQFEYAFDTIGNRRTNGFGGNEVGLSLRESRYTVNDLNQYTSRTVPGYVNILGETTNTASVSVNTTKAYRKDRYFRAELTVDNSANPLWLGITNLAVMPVGGGNYVVSNVTGHVFVSKTPESFGYDADGNLTQDGRWNYTWDAENRLVRVESRPDTPPASWRKVEWQYDTLGRRIRQTTSDGSSGSWVMTEDLKFVSDGWRCIAELDTSHSALRTYMWGLDLNGGLDGAGGVGGCSLFMTPQPSTINPQPISFATTAMGTLWR